MLHVQSKGASSDARVCSWLLLELTGLVLVLLLLTLALAPAAIAVASVATMKPMPEMMRKVEITAPPCCAPQLLPRPRVA